MSDADSDFDEEAHTKLLEAISSLGTQRKKKPLTRKCNKKVRAEELVNFIHSTRNVDDVKKKLVRKKKKRKAAAANEPHTLQAPAHRQARERIESSIAYSDIRKGLQEWAPVVKKNRLAEQLVFPLEKDPPVGQTASERLSFFKPRTPMEKEIAGMLATSKNNLRDGEKYTEAELELLRAMSLKEAKAKWAQLQKMRALVGYREAKLKRQAKIKSKSYHRHLKRQKRKKLIKEFEEMMMKDPEAAKEKLEEIDKQRILERATLKHRNGGKNIQQLAKYASKNKEFKKTYEEQIRLGRELAEKHGREKDSDSESEGEDTAKLSSAEMLQRAADVLEKEELETRTSKPELRTKLHEMRKRKQEALIKSAAEAQNAVAASTSPRDRNMDTETPSTSVEHSKEPTESERETNVTLLNEEQCNKEQDQQDIQNCEQLSDNKADEGESRKNLKKLKKKGPKKLKKKKNSVNIEDVNIDQLFDKAEKDLAEAALKECKLLSTEKEKSSCHPVHSVPAVKPIKASQIRKKQKSAMETDSAPVDISLDPRHFLQVETSSVPQVSAEFIEDEDNSTEETEGQEAIIAKAFEDIDVIGDFEAEKEAVEAAENPKDLDLTLQGWGSWTGPGIIDNKKNKFIIKAEKKKRKDAGRTGVIISEAVDQSIEKIQLRSVPFPYTTVEDYEAVVRQPLGKEWNPQRIHKQLIKPQILTKAGRIIKPLDRSVLHSESTEEKHSDSELF